ncbi:MAG: hypothetical protein NTX03_11395, partial [Bacteroidetes bacterium]|nr:hypothetical protein [Bacteroidota bacterium]
ASVSAITNPVGVRGIIEEIIDEVKRISRGMNADYLSKSGLVDAINNEVLRMQKASGIKVSLFIGEKAHPIDGKHSLVLFRILQEVLNNALKHSKATDISIHLFESPTTLLRITDNGQGFNVAEKLSIPKGMGLQNLKKRAGMIGYNCQIISALQQGTEYIFNKIN